LHLIAAIRNLQATNNKKSNLKRELLIDQVNLIYTQNLPHSADLAVNSDEKAKANFEATIEHYQN
jgi:hypothetical protein